MLARLREDRRLRKLNNEARAIRDSFAVSIQSADDGNGSRERLMRDADFEAAIPEDEIDEIRSNRLIHSALQLSLPIPYKTDGSVHWCRSSVLGSWALTNFGLTELRKAIRQERRERREAWLAWGGLVIGILGLLVAALALLVSSHWFDGHGNNAPLLPQEVRAVAVPAA